MVNKCLTKFNILNKFIEYYSTFYLESKRNLIQLIKNKLNLTKDNCDGSTKALKNTFTKIINQKETMKPFFEINYVKIVLKVVQNNQNNNSILNKEIIFLVDELKEINKNAYIKNNLLPDITNFSHLNNIQNLISDIIYFIETFNKIKPLQILNFYNTLNSNYDIISK